MFVLDKAVVVYSASDLAIAATCEFAALRALDVKLGRLPRVEVVDAMLQRTATLGDRHEERVLASYVDQFGEFDPATGRGVASIKVAGTYDSATLTAKHAETMGVLSTGADVVFQGAFFDGRFHGRSDFLVKEGDAYTVFDSKLARHAKITALLQLAAYGDQLLSAGVPINSEVALILGDRTTSRHSLDDLLPVYRERRQRLQEILDRHLSSSGPIAWGDSLVLACGRCDVCAAEVDAHHDLLLVAGLRTSQRTVLRAAGVHTIEQLASSDGSIDGVSVGSLQRLRSQAKLQIAQRELPADADGRPQVRHEVFDAEPLLALPSPDDGDIFFDFEGDPLWTDDDAEDWGLEYLFGVVEAGPDERFESWWAHDRPQEKQALVEFLRYVADRRAKHPGMHIYHYASYERTALLRLAARHNTGEQIIDDLLRDGVLVDLYSTVRQSIRVSQPSYSLKKLEPLYMGTQLRSAELDNAADSIVAYAEACALRDEGKTADSGALFARIADYNNYDCTSTLRLAGWLRQRAVDSGATAFDLPTAPPPAAAKEPDELADTLYEAAGEGPRGDRTPDQQAYAMLSASLGYHSREQKPFWWAHFARLRDPVDDWVGSRDVFVPDVVEVVEDWHLPPRARSQRRLLRLSGELPDGSLIAAGTKMKGIYAQPLPTGMVPPSGGVRATGGSVEVMDVQSADGRDVMLVEELVLKGAVAGAELPMALCPMSGPGTLSIEAALRELARDVEAEGRLKAQPGLDVLRRRGPRASGGLPQIVDGDAVTAITAALVALDRSYVAVQGPPGTGKTHVGARVVARLVVKGWRIGVVAQSHAVVEHFLDAVVAAGVAPALVGKKAEQDSAHPWTVLSSDDYAEFLADAAETGCVLGGTAWDFTNTTRVQRGQLDLVVVDEAGQFALANTVAVSVASSRLLLLGDPQQLPQVSQGTHPEPVDDSALGWLASGHAALPAERGYFLDRTWRMHPALCGAVSRLSYENRLRSQVPETTDRHLTGLAAGVHAVYVAHQGRAVASPEEASEVVAQVQRVLGLEWSDRAEADGPRPLGQRDILVVAAYNAQVQLIRHELAKAGHPDVQVGTVDKFQGREAAVVIVSMAASSHDDVPRGMGFLLSRNRINVAVSRGKWAAIIVRSPWLTDYLPATPYALAELGAFIGLTSAGRPALGAAALTL